MHLYRGFTQQDHGTDGHHQSHTFMEYEMSLRLSSYYVSSTPLEAEVSAIMEPNGSNTFTALQMHSSVQHLFQDPSAWAILDSSIHHQGDL